MLPCILLRWRWFEYFYHTGFVHATVAERIYRRRFCLKREQSLWFSRRNSRLFLEANNRRAPCDARSRRLALPDSVLATHSGQTEHCMLAIRGKPVFLHGNHGTAPCVWRPASLPPQKSCGAVTRYIFARKRLPVGTESARALWIAACPMTIPFEIHPT